jgi:hypothetical protein
MDYNLKNKSREHTDINSSEVTILLIEEFQLINIKWMK